MASFDLPQLQWQYIRSTEREQCTELENQRLRKEVASLFDSSSRASKVNAQFAVTFQAAIHKFATLSKAELMKLKLTYIQELNALMKEKQLLSDAFSKLIGLLPIQEKEIEVYWRVYMRHTAL